MAEFFRECSAVMTWLRGTIIWEAQQKTAEEGARNRHSPHGYMNNLDIDTYIYIYTYTHITPASLGL